MNIYREIPCNAPLRILMVTRTFLVAAMVPRMLGLFAQSMGQAVSVTAGIVFPAVKPWVWILLLPLPSVKPWTLL